MIGIIDYGFLKRARGTLPLPNLDAMKYYVYLRETRPEENIMLLSSLDQMKNCGEVYLFSDDLPEKLPKEIYLATNVQFFGQFFSPIPKIVEHTNPSTQLYHSIIEAETASETISTARALSFLNSIYYKAWGEGGERLPLPPFDSRKRIYLYDKDILQREDGWEMLLGLLGRKPSSVHTIHPLRCRSVKQFIKVRIDYENIISRSNEIILDFFVPLHQLDYYFSKYKLLLLGEITSNSNVKVYVGKNYANDTYCEGFYLRNFIYNVHLIYSYWSRGIPIKVVEYHGKDNEDAANPLGFLYSGLRRWAATTAGDRTIRMILGKTNQKKLDEVLQKYPMLERFLDISKNSLTEEWKIYDE